MVSRPDAAGDARIRGHDAATAAGSSVTSGQVAAEPTQRNTPVLVSGIRSRRLPVVGREGHESADVDLLAPPRQVSRARSVLASAGWRFVPYSGLLWRLDRAVALDRTWSWSPSTGGSTWGFPPA